MNREIIFAINKIMALAVALKHVHIFVEYMPHVESIDIRFYPQPWREDLRELWWKVVRLKHPDSVLGLEEIYNRIQADALAVVEDAALEESA